ncbi:glutamate formimidoyltransferase [bacterium]|nr:glutamate formimidoyltransferase [bacterium]
MSVKIVECVPNFSEGRDMKVIEQITDAIKSVSDVELKDVDPGYATNRTVVTFIGTPEGVLEAAFRAIKKASELIDMSKHHGAHPRFGATDVCPFVPVEGVDMDDCVELAKKLGRRVGEELGIPVYLYEYAAQSEERRNLAMVRKGEYEGLPEKLADPRWKPDFGPVKFNPKTGAIAIGAREFLIAYNITLNTDEKRYATDIAFELREKGRAVRTGNIEPFYFRGKLVKHRDKYLCGECDFSTDELDELEKHTKNVHGYSVIELMRLNNIEPHEIMGRSVRKRGMFTHCKAIGWYVKEYGRAQISINLTNYKITPPHIVLEAARELAARRGLVVTGSEIVGLVPYQAMLMAGKYYLEKQRKSTGVPPQDIIKTAIYSMGLNDVAPFDPEEKIIGMPKIPKDALVSMTTKEFIDEVSRSSPAPGGGSVAALSGALGAALTSMVANLTTDKAQTKEEFATFVEIAQKAQTIKEKLCAAVDEDTQAFNDYLEAMRLPKKTEEERRARDEAIQRGLKNAVKVPLNTAKLSFDALELAAKIAEIGNRASVSDAGVGAQTAFSGIVGGTLNVLINLGDITDEKFVGDMKSECEKILSEARKILDDTLEVVKRRIEEMWNKN